MQAAPTKLALTWHSSQAGRPARHGQVIQKFYGAARSLTAAQPYTCILSGLLLHGPSKRRVLLVLPCRPVLLLIQTCMRCRGKVKTDDTIVLACGWTCRRGPTSVKRYSSFLVVGILCVRNADVHSACIASSLQHAVLVRMAFSRGITRWTPKG